MEKYFQKYSLSKSMNMEILITTSFFLILGLMIVFPIILLIILKKFRTKRIFIIYALVSLFILGLLTLIFAWWADKSDMILLEHYGYNDYAENNTERFQNVAQENLERVKQLEESMMGVGWPLHAILVFPYIILYLTIVYLGKIVIDD